MPLKATNAMSTRRNILDSRHSRNNGAAALEDVKEHERAGWATIVCVLMFFAKIYVRTFLFFI